MKQLVPVLALLAAGGAQAQADATYHFYGLIDTSLRHATHETPSGGSRTQLTDGVLTGSRVGLRGAEDLGGGLRAKFVLEHGFMPDTGAVAQGGIQWGRQVYAGVELPSGGELRLGRQYTVAHEIITSYEAMALANNSIVGFQSNYTAVRGNNMLRYAHKLGGFTAIAGYAPGEGAGTRAAALGAIYESGPLRVGAVYQQRDNVASYFGTAATASDQTTWSVGGTYQFPGLKLFLGYTDSEMDRAERRNRVVYAGFNYKASAAGSLIGTVNHDRLSGRSDGRRVSASLMYDHYLSKRTDVYLATDYTRLKDGWMTLATTAGFSTPFYGTHNTRLGLQAGIRHVF